MFTVSDGLWKHMQLKTNAIIVVCLSSTCLRAWGECVCVCVCVCVCLCVHIFVSSCAFVPLTVNKCGDSTRQVLSLTKCF